MNARQALKIMIRSYAAAEGFGPWRYKASTIDLAARRFHRQIKRDVRLWRAAVRPAATEGASPVSEPT